MSLPDLVKYPVVAIDTETTGLDWTQEHVFGVAVAVPKCTVEQLVADPLGAPVESMYFDTRQRSDLYQGLRDQAARLKLVVNHNIKFDLHMLHNDDVHIDPATTECTMIRAALINEHLMRYDLDTLGKKYLGIEKVADIYQQLADLFGGHATRNAQMKNLKRAPAEMVRPYAVRDAENALRLWAWQEGEIAKQKLGAVWDLERRLFPHIFDMERHGIRVDLDAAQLQAERLGEQVERGQVELNKLAGFEVNPNPSGSIIRLFDPKQNADGTWTANDGTPLLSTSAGKPSIGSEALSRMQHPAAAKILQLRKLKKTKDTFLEGHVMSHARHGRVHPNINQVKGDETGGTGTGRLSYTQPALQQIPSRDKHIASLVRPVFLPDEGHGWSYGDLDQHELRIFHHYVNNPKIVDAYRQDPNMDGHQIVADLTGLPRNPLKSGGANAKQMNLAMVFNMGSGELADRMGLPYTMDSFTDNRGQEHVFKKAGTEAQEIMDRYHSMVPGVREMARKARTIAKSRGYVRTLMGRHIRFPGGQFTHKASGLVYQGTSADLNKDNIIRVCEYLRAECPEAKVLLNIHDELSVSIPRGADHVALCRGMRDVIQDRPEIRVPIRIDFSEPAANWWGATQADPVL